LGCALGSWKRQQICCSSGGSSIGSCGIGCCGGGGSVGAAAVGCTLTVGAAGRDLVGAGGVLRLCPRGSHYALATWASPSRLALRPRGSGFALAAHAMRSRLRLRPRGSALPSRLTLRACGSGCGGCGSGGGGSGSDGGECLPSRLALHARRLGLCPRGSASPLRLALRARGSALPKHNNQTAKQRPQKLLRQCCRLSAAAVAAGGSSAGSCGGIGCGSVGGSVSVSGNGGSGGGGSSGGCYRSDVDTLRYHSRLTLPWIPVRLRALFTLFSVLGVGPDPRAASPLARRQSICYLQHSAGGRRRYHHVVCPLEKAINRPAPLG
jgi:hypothetical protein